MSPARGLVAAVVLALAGCGSAPPTASPAPAGSPDPSALAPIALPEPGPPYDADDLLEAMRESRRPGGVPAELQDAEISAQLAQRLWTFDGEPWDAIAAGGTCDGSSCSLELSGGSQASDGEDVWVFAIDAATGSVEVVTADLHAVPAETARELDALARELDEAGLLQDLLTTAVRWLPPPAEDRFRLAYRSGNEEESCSVDLELDAAAGRITDLDASGC